MTPTGASSLVSVNITGSGFHTTAANNEVSFVPANGAPMTALATAIAPVDVTRDLRRITVRVPAGLATGTTALRVRNTVTESAKGESLQVIALSLPDVTSATPGSPATSTCASPVPRIPVLSPARRKSVSDGHHDQQRGGEIAHRVDRQHHHSCKCGAGCSHAADEQRADRCPSGRLHHRRRAVAHTHVGLANDRTTGTDADSHRQRRLHAFRCGDPGQLRQRHDCRGRDGLEPDRVDGAPAHRQPGDRGFPRGYGDQ